MLLLIITVSPAVSGCWLWPTTTDVAVSVDWVDSDTVDWWWCSCTTLSAGPTDPFTATATGLPFMWYCCRWRSRCLAANWSRRRRLQSYTHARRSLSTVGGTHSGQSTPHYCTPLIHLHSFPPPERCKVSQQVWNWVMNWIWTCVSPYCDLLD